MQIVRDAAGVPQEIRMRKPWNLHTHVRQGDITQLVVPMEAARFAGAVIMPNTKPPITTCAMLDAYRSEIETAVHFRESGSEHRENMESASRAAVVGGVTFVPLMTLYLTDHLDPHEVERAIPAKAIGIKYYPRGLTTGSDSGVKNPASLWTKGTTPYNCLRVLAQKNGTFLMHAANGLDAQGGELDPYDQEIDFVKESLPRIRDAHPDLRMTFEHLSTTEGAEYMRCNGGPLLGCTITAQHYLLDRRDTHRGGYRPHCSWWPIIQGKEHKESVQSLGREGHSFVFLGLDSAPHPLKNKECGCVMGGVLMAHAGIELYVEAFENMNALDMLEPFASVYGPHFYGLPLSTEEITLVREEWQPPEFFHRCGNPTGDRHEECIKPFRAGEAIRWKLVQ